MQRWQPFISTNMIDGDGGSCNIDKKKVRPVLHMYEHCKREVQHKDANCLDLDSNKAK